MTRLAERHPVGNVIPAFRVGFPRKLMVSVQRDPSLSTTLTSPIVAFVHRSPPIHVFNPPHVGVSSIPNPAAVPVGIPSPAQQWMGFSAFSVPDSFGSLFGKFTVRQFSSKLQRSHCSNTRIQRRSQALTFARAIHVARVGQLLQAHGTTATRRASLSVSGVGCELRPTRIANFVVCAGFSPLESSVWRHGSIIRVSGRRKYGAAKMAKLSAAGRKKG